MCIRDSLEAAHLIKVSVRLSLKHRYLLLDVLPLLKTTIENWRPETDMTNTKTRLPDW